MYEQHGVGIPSLVPLNYQQVLDALADAVVAADTGNRIVYVNGALERLLGRSRDELLGQPLTVLMPERFRALHCAGFERYLATGISHILDRPIRVPALAASGQELDIELTISRVRDAGEQIVFIATMRDLRDRVELERQLTVTRYLRAATAAAARLTSRLDLQQVLQTVVETQVHGFDAALARIWLYDADAGVLHLRASAGLSEDTERSARAHIHVASYPYKIARVARTLEPFIKNGLLGDPEFDQEWVQREGIAGVAVLPLVLAGRLQGIMVHFARTSLSDDVIEVLTTFSVMVLTTVHDLQLVEAERRAREEAEAASDRLAFLAEAAQVLGASLDPQTTLTNLAQLAVSRLADWCSVYIVEESGSANQVVVAHADPSRVAWAQEFQRRFPFRPDAAYGIARVLRTGEPEIVPVVDEDLLARALPDEDLRDILRELRICSTMIVPLAVQGRILGAISFVFSESGRYYAERDAALAQDLASRAAVALDNARLHRELQDALRAREELLSSISHDLKNPLTAIKGQVQILQRRVQRVDGDERPHLERGLESVIVTTARMNRIINDLIDVTRLRAGRPLDLTLEQVDLVALVRQMVEEFQRTSAGHRILVRSSLPSLVGEWDAVRLERVLANLLSNAIKYSPQGGEIAVEVQRLESEAGPLTVLRVTDEGMGIPVVDLPLIFQRFHRGSNVAGRIDGTGIGLAGARQIVEQHGGTIEVESREGEGSMFTVILPMDVPQ